MWIHEGREGGGGVLEVKTPAPFWGTPTLKQEKKHDVPLQAIAQRFSTQGEAQGFILVIWVKHFWSEIMMEICLTGLIRAIGSVLLL